MGGERHYGVSAQPRSPSKLTSSPRTAHNAVSLAPFACAIGPAVAAALLSGVMLLRDAIPTGIVVLPLDDSYIHLQYGWQAAQGHFLQYNTGDAPTSGATSLLYMLMVALGFAAGVTRVAMPAVVAAVGVVGFALSSALLTGAVHRMASMLQLPAYGAALLATLWFSGSGWMAWSFLSGMETAFLILFVVGTLWALVHQRPGLASLFASLATLTRPEAVGLGLAALIASVLAPPLAGRPRGKGLILLSLPVLAACVSPMVNWLLTGSLSPTGFLAKSWITNQPYDPRVVVWSTAATFRELVLGLMGGISRDGRWHAFPLLQLLAAAGVCVVWRHRPARRVALTIALWSVGLLVVTATLQTATWHHYRYQMPAYPALVLAGALGATTVVSRIKGALARYARAALPLAALVWSCYSLADFWHAYRVDVGTIAGMQMELSAWLGSNTPPDARVAVHDVGVMRYSGERYTIDAVGLTTKGMVEASRGGPGVEYEALRRAKPDYYAIYPAVAPPFYGVSSAAFLLGEEMYRVTLPWFSPYTSAADTQVVTRPDWTGADRGDSPCQPDVLDRTRSLNLVDSLNVADVTDERDHNHVWWSHRGFKGFVSEVWHMPYRQDHGVVLADGGRVFDGGQAFSLLTPYSLPVFLVGRFHQLSDAIIDVQVNGLPVGAWRLPAIPGEWQESVFEAPASAITGDVTRVALTVRQDAQQDTRAGVYYLWAYQGESAGEHTAPLVRAHAQFGDVAELLAYDLPSTEHEPGDAIRLTLYLRAMNPSPADWRIFAHLVDPDDDSAAGILSQWDAAPRAGTYPFWVWRPDEVVEIPVRLEIPAEASADDYVVLIGLYDGETGQRAAIGYAPDYGSSRMHVATIHVGP